MAARERKARKANRRRGSPRDMSTSTVIVIFVEYGDTSRKTVIFAKEQDTKSTMFHKMDRQHQAQHISRHPLHQPAHFHRRHPRTVRSSTAVLRRTKTVWIFGVEGQEGAISDHFVGANEFSDHGRSGTRVEMMVDSGSTATVCGLEHFSDTPVTIGPPVRLRASNGQPLKHYGQKKVELLSDSGEKMQLLREWQYKTVPLLQTDSQSALAVCKRRGPGRMKHIELKMLAVQEWLKTGRLRIHKVSTHDNPADLMTKAMNREKLIKFGRALTLRGAFFTDLSHSAQKHQIDVTVNQSLKSSQLR